MTFLTQRVAAVEEEMKEVRRENTELRMPLLCEGCRRIYKANTLGTRLRSAHAPIVLGLLKKTDNSTLAISVV